MMRDAYTCDMCGRDIIVDDQTTEERLITTSPTIVKILVPGKYEHSPGKSVVYGDEKVVTYCRYCTEQISKFITNKGCPDFYLR